MILHQQHCRLSARIHATRSRLTAEEGYHGIGIRRSLIGRRGQAVRAKAIRRASNRVMFFTSSPTSHLEPQPSHRAQTIMNGLEVADLEAPLKAIKRVTLG